jgi:hypothetical protein
MYSWEIILSILSVQQVGFIKGTAYIAWLIFFLVRIVSFEWTVFCRVWAIVGSQPWIPFDHLRDVVCDFVALHGMYCHEFGNCSERCLRWLVEGPFASFEYATLYGLSIVILYDSIGLLRMLAGDYVSMYGTDTLEAHLGVALGHLWR